MAEARKLRLDLQQRCPVEGCEKRYYSGLYFLDPDLYWAPNAPVRKRTLPPERAEAAGTYSVGWFRDGLLVRLDRVETYLPTETYLVREGGLVREAHTLMVGHRGLFASGPLPPQMDRSYHYTYDRQGRVERIVWRQSAAACIGRIEVLAREDFTYDRQGLLRVRSEWRTAGKPPESFVLYDREREELLRESTISRAPRRYSRNKAGGPVDFSNRAGFGSKHCPHCGQVLDHICGVDLTVGRVLHRERLPEQLPVLFCQTCLSDQTYTLEELTLPGKLAGVGRCLPVVLGGAPDWMQGEDHPVCPDCGRPMVFLMEVKSQGDVMFGDEGSLYIFHCCGHTAVRMQGG